MMMALYWSRSGSRRDSLRRIPSVMYLMSVDWREEGGWRERKRRRQERKKDRMEKRKKGDNFHLGNKTLYFKIERF